MNLEAYMGEHTPKRKVYLHGYLGELFGKEFDLAVRSPVEAIKLLEANFPRKFSEAVKKGTFQVLVSGPKLAMQCTLEMCHFLFPQGSIHIIPVPEGSGGSGGSKSKGLILAIVGVALIATAFVGAAFLSGAATIGAGLGTSIFAGVTWGQIGLLGAALLLLGVAILLTPTPKPDNKPDTYQSFFYSGAINSDREGGCVPICYGRVWAGSVVIAGGIFDDKFAITNNPVVYSSYTESDNAGAWIAEGSNSDNVNDDPNKLYLDGSAAGINAHDPGDYVQADPAAPTGGVTQR
jgi:predicted phage tail protein